jgi:histidine ammonia-lyase
MSERLFKCTLTGGGVFYVVAGDATQAAEAVERQWRAWGYVDKKGYVVSIEVLAEEGQYPDVPSRGSIGANTWLLVRPC